MGEIAENWETGYLAETALTRYHIDYENPLPLLQEAINALNEEVRMTFDLFVCNNNLSSWLTLAFFALLGFQRPRD